MLAFFMAHTGTIMVALTTFLGGGGFMALLAYLKDRRKATSDERIMYLDRVEKMMTTWESKVDCLEKKLDEANAKMNELMVENTKLKDEVIRLGAENRRMTDEIQMLRLELQRGIDVRK